MLNQPRTFRCPNCNEMINDSMQQCRYCSVPLDPAIVALVAERQEKANQACSDASYLKTASMVMFVFLALSFIPIMPLVRLGFLITFFVVLVLLISWQVKFGSLLTSDVDYKTAKQRKNLALILWLAAIPLAFIIRPLVDFLIARSL